MWPPDEHPHLSLIAIDPNTSDFLQVQITISDKETFSFTPRYINNFNSLQYLVRQICTYFDLFSVVFRK